MTLTLKKLDGFSLTSSKSRLTKTMYGMETDSKKTLFGLVNGQFRTDSVLNNAGWFNEKGEKLGYGDINHNDLARIVSDMRKDEKFIVLPEFDTSWGLPKGADGNNPGYDYVIQHAAWVVLPNGVVLRARNFDKHLPPEKETKNKLTYQKLHYDDMFMLIGYEKPGKKSEEKKKTKPLPKEIKDLMEPILLVPPMFGSVKSSSITSTPVNISGQSVVNPPILPPLKTIPFGGVSVGGSKPLVKPATKKKP